ncbi:MAG TPA: hypothetical protein VFB31_07520 [Pseudolabrys sp.]|nr:hypothetical protein [Pseudolabrys sp.]
MSVQAHPHPALAPQAKPGEKGAGRVCPLDYAYQPSLFARAPDFACDVLYAVGGLYGNRHALEAVNDLAARERHRPILVFNGDFHWLDAEPGWFAEIERGVSAHRALRGNVETEISRLEDIGAGCGCDYPETVGEDVVRRSNETLLRLRAQTPAAARDRLRALPMHLVAQVGALRIGIVHGDAQSLAGWQFAQAALDDAANRAWLDRARAASTIDLFACTHTGEAALRDYALPSGRLTVANNGAAGLPNFSGSRFGVVTRIATTPSPQQPLYGLARDGVFVDALAVDYDHDGFVRRFLACWPPGSSAFDSYYRRIVDGADYSFAKAGPR